MLRRQTTSTSSPWTLTLPALVFVLLPTCPFHLALYIGAAGATGLVIGPLTVQATALGVLGTVLAVLALRRNRGAFACLAGLAMMLLAWGLLASDAGTAPIYGGFVVLGVAEIRERWRHASAGHGAQSTPGGRVPTPAA